MHSEPKHTRMAEKAGSCALPVSPSEGCILVITGRPSPSQPVMTHAINVAERLRLKVIMVRVGSSSLLRERSRSLLAAHRLSAGEESAHRFVTQAATRDVVVEVINEVGNIGKIVNRVCHVVKRVKFAVIDEDIAIEEVAAGSPVPVFRVVSSTGEPSADGPGRHLPTLFQGDGSMKATTRRTYFAKTLIFGAMTAGLYGAVFAYSDVIMRYWTKGGLYCLLPVATVFVFSYAHGSFTGNFWSALGIEGSKASMANQKQATTSKSDTKRKDTRPRLQVNA